jgi:hypothetical protein
VHEDSTSVAGTEGENQKPTEGVTFEPPFWDLRRRRKRFIATYPPSKYVDAIQAFDVSKCTSIFIFSCQPDWCLSKWCVVNNRVVCKSIFLTKSISVKLRMLILPLGHAVAQWLRHCATNWKVGGSIPDGVNGFFHWHNPSGRIMDLGSTQRVTVMSTRNISWG